MPSSPVVVALVGNPNAGKSTLFNALSGLRQHVGNYPGVTVEMTAGRFTHDGTEYELLDLPGTYSLAPRSPDELVTVELLLGRTPGAPKPDVILSIVDASNIDRHLYLTTQLMEIGKPVVLAVNMLDVAAARGVSLDLVALAKSTGLRVVGLTANRGLGVPELKAALKHAVTDAAPTAGPMLATAVMDEEAKLQRQLNGDVPSFLARRLLLDVGGYTEQWLVAKHGPTLQSNVEAARTRLSECGHPVASAEAKARYGWIRGVTAQAVTKPTVRPVTVTDRLDRVLTHRVWGTLIFLAIMFLVFQAIFTAAEPVMGLIDDGFKWLARSVENQLPAGPARSLLTDGIIGGVGGVVKFIPQILILFGFIAVLEDCGYMARAAFLMDRLMSRCGLSGKSFIPLLSSVACAIPGIMATRTIENRRDRFATILVAPLMSCSARLPVYALLTGAFLTDGYPWWVPGLVLFGLYMIGFTVAPLVALILKRTLLRGDPPLFVMELPSYKRPSLPAILRRMFDAGWAFLYRAGTLIFCSMVLVWAVLYFPATDAAGVHYADRIAAAGDDETEAKRLAAEWKEQSYLGRTGKGLEPVFRPLGWDWKLGMAALASFPAREVIVGTLGILYQQGEVDAADAEQRKQLGEAVRAEWEADPVRGKYGVAVALSVMVFFALCCQCASTLAVIRRETRSWWWPAFTFTYMTTFAYVSGVATFQLGKLITDAVT